MKALGETQLQYIAVYYILKYTLQIKFSQYFVSYNPCNARYKSGVFF